MNCKHLTTFGLLFVLVLTMPVHLAQGSPFDSLNAISSIDLYGRRVIGLSVESSLAESPIPQIKDTLRQLRNKARIGEVVRVIIGVRAAFPPEGYQDSRTRQLQRQEIGVVQSIIELAS